VSDSQSGSVRIVPLRPIDGRIEEMSDEALVGACAFSDRAALAALFDRHHRRVHGFLFRMGVDRADIEDLLQDTFTALWTSAQRYHGQAPALTWIFGIASNLAKNYARSRFRRDRALKSLEMAPPPAPEAVDERADKRMMVKRLNDALLELPHDRRAALIMCDLEGASGKDAARALGVRPGTIWRWLHQARKTLRAALEEERP
jgi:RNA polymerase sigma-70 factor (ECF subfamily)